MSLTETLVPFFSATALIAWRAASSASISQIHRQVEMRHGLLGLRAGAARSPCASMLCGTARVARRHEHRLAAGGAVRPSAPALAPAARRAGLRRLDIGLDDAAVRAAALDARRDRAGLARPPCAWRAARRRCGSPLGRPAVARHGAAAGAALRPRLPERRGCGGAGGRSGARCGGRGRRGARRHRSSPSSSSMAIGAFTFTPSVPSGTRILPSMPSSTASTSMVALSVSISRSRRPT